MEFLVEFEVEVPVGTPHEEVGTPARRVRRRGQARGGWASRSALETASGDGATAIGLYRADSRGRVNGLLGALPLADWLHITVTPLEGHPNDPVRGPSMSDLLPDPSLTLVYRLEAVLGEPLDLGEVTGAPANRPLTGGTFAGLS